MLNSSIRKDEQTNKVSKQTNKENCIAFLGLKDNIFDRKLGQDDRIKPSLFGTVFLL